MESVELEIVGELLDLVDEVLGRVDDLGPVGLSVAKKIRRDDPVRAFEVSELVIPETMADGSVMDEHNWLAISAVDEAQPIAAEEHGVHGAFPSHDARYSIASDTDLYRVRAMTPERIRRRPRAETRRDLLDAATRVFAREGFRGTSVEAVSEEAGYSRGALYSNFKSKEDLFLALWEERIERRRRELREVMRRAGDPASGLSPVSANVMEALDRERDWFLLYFEFVLHATRDREFAQRFERVREQGLAELATGIADGLENAGLKSSVAASDIALALKALSYGLAIERLANEGAVPKDLCGRVVELIFRGIRAELE